MARERPSVPHDFPDRVIRDALVHPANLRALLGRVAPEVAAKLDFDRREVVNRSYLLDDWRRREADVCKQARRGGRRWRWCGRRTRSATSSWGAARGAEPDGAAGARDLG
jgi:hypothetical protein